MELISRVNALLRRHERDVQASQRESGAAGDEDVLEAGPICLDVARYQVTAAGAEVQLTHKEFEMLRYLMENRGIVVSRDLLLDRVWGYSIAGETRTVDAMCNAEKEAFRGMSRGGDVYRNGARRWLPPEGVGRLWS